MQYYLNIRESHLELSHSAANNSMKFLIDQAAISSGVDVDENTTFSHIPHGNSKEESFCSTFSRSKFKLRLVV